MVNSLTIRIVLPLFMLSCLAGCSREASQTPPGGGPEADAASKAHSVGVGQNLPPVTLTGSVRGDVGGVMVLDDYGHHPTEIRLTLSGIKEGWKRRIIAVFQPHRYTRVNFLMEEFCTSFYEADAVVVTDIYRAGETPIPGVTAEAVTAGIKKHGHKDVVLIKDFDEIVDYLAQKVEPNDIVVGAQRRS